MVVAAKATLPRASAVFACPRSQSPLYNRGEQSWDSAVELSCAGTHFTAAVT